eukprot:GHVP01041760.1.p1 GENE.GHVP01041760.1~~GHVP01041760.1.p1  ORF type:complete len:436 (+),score=67.86 GHVP01041760.1:33-1310(+)
MRRLTMVTDNQMNDLRAHLKNFMTTHQVRQAEIVTVTRIGAPYISLILKDPRRAHFSEKRKANVYWTLMDFTQRYERGEYGNLSRNSRSRKSRTPVFWRTVEPPEEESELYGRSRSRRPRRSFAMSSDSDSDPQIVRRKARHSMPASIRTFQKSRDPFGRQGILYIDGEGSRVLGEIRSNPNRIPLFEVISEIDKIRKFSEIFGKPRFQFVTIPVVISAYKKGELIEETILWNSNEDGQLVDVFAESFRQDNDLATCQHKPITDEMRRQIKEAKMDIREFEELAAFRPYITRKLFISVEFKALRLQLDVKWNVKDTSIRNIRTFLRSELYEAGITDPEAHSLLMNEFFLVLFEQRKAFVENPVEIPISYSISKDGFSEGIRIFDSDASRERVTRRRANNLQVSADGNLATATLLSTPGPAETISL